MKHRQRRAWPLKVYFIRRPDTREIKIGVSTSPESRLAALQCGSARRLQLLVTHDGGFEDEHAWHRMLRKEHIAFEWFKESERLWHVVYGIKEAIARGVLTDAPVGEWPDEQAS
jgi:hypothetical protein